MITTRVREPLTAPGAFPPWPSLALVVGTFVAQVVGITLGMVGLAFFSGLAGHHLGRARLQALAHDPGSAPLQGIELFAYALTLVLIVIFLPRLARRPLGAQAFAFRGVATLSAILLGIATALVLMLLDAVYIGALHQEHHTQTGFANFAPHGTLALTISFLLIGVFAPVVEELQFRALLFPALATRMPTWVAAVVASAIFGGIHGDLVLFPVLAGLGLASCWLYVRTGSLFASIALHMTNNVLAFGSLVGGLAHHH